MTYFADMSITELEARFDEIEAAIGAPARPKIYPPSTVWSIWPWPPESPCRRRPPMSPICSMS